MPYNSASLGGREPEEKLSSQGWTGTVLKPITTFSNPGACHLILSASFINCSLHCHYILCNLKVQRERAEEEQNKKKPVAPEC